MSREELRCVMDPAMVLLSILMAYIGSYMAISLLEQLRLYQVNIMDADLIQSLTETDDKSSDKNSIDDNTNTNINTKSNEVAVGKTYLFNSKAQMKFAILVSLISLFLTVSILLLTL